MSYSNAELAPTMLVEKAESAVPLFQLSERECLVFEAKPRDRFEIFIQRGIGKPELLISSERHCLFPAPSPCGRYIAYSEAETEERTARAAIYLFDRLVGSKTLLSSEASFPSFSVDGKTIFFESARKEVKAIAIDGSSSPRTIFSREETGFARYQVAKPRLTADETTCYVTSDRGGRWNVWAVSLIDSTVEHIGPGCEPVAFENGNTVAWVCSKGKFSGTELRLKNRETGESRVILSGHPSRFQYFPSLHPSGKYLLCSLSVPGTFLRRSACYGLAIVEISSGRFRPLPRFLKNSRWGRWISETASMVTTILIKSTGLLGVLNIA